MSVITLTVDVFSYVAGRIEVGRGPQGLRRIQVTTNGDIARCVDLLNGAVGQRSSVVLLRLRRDRALNFFFAGATQDRIFFVPSTTALNNSPPSSER